MKDGNRKTILVVVIAIIIIFGVGMFKKEAIHYSSELTSSECDSNWQIRIDGGWEKVSICAQVTSAKYNCINYYQLQNGYGNCPQLYLDGWSFIYCDASDCPSDIYNPGDCSEAFYKCVITAEWEVPPDACVDSDGGIEYYIYGEISPTNNYDFCLDADQLIEYYCVGGQVNNEMYTCPEGCSNGVCSGGTSCCPQEADTSSPCNNDITWSELDAYITKWATRVIYCGHTITWTQLESQITYWATH